MPTVTQDRYAPAVAVDPTIVWIRRSASSRRSGDRLVVVPLAAPDHVAVISGLAATVWHLLRQAGSVDDLAAVLADHWSMDEAELRSQVSDAVEGLVNEQLLTESH